MSKPSSKKPYTNKQIRKLDCHRCGDPAETRWNICSDGGRYRTICLLCDLKLNKMVLLWMGWSEEEAEGKMLKYLNRLADLGLKV